MIIPIDETKAHKHIIIKARCCSACGQVSEWKSKQYFVSCRFSKITLLDNKDTLNKKVIMILNAKEKCQDVYYTIDGTEPTMQSNKYQNGIHLGAFGLTTTKQRKITIKASIICNDTGGKGETISKDYILPSVQVMAVGNFVLGVGNKVLGQIGKV